jgi:hypothetical protein
MMDDSVHVGAACDGAEDPVPGGEGMEVERVRTAAPVGLGYDLARTMFWTLLDGASLRPATWLSKCMLSYRLIVEGAEELTEGDGGSVPLFGGNQV